jgi:hypothetical protein
MTSAFWSLNSRKIANFAGNSENGGRRWIRTIEGVSQQIYSLPPLATWVSYHATRSSFGDRETGPIREVTRYRRDSWRQSLDWHFPYQVFRLASDVADQLTSRITNLRFSDFRFRIFRFRIVSNLKSFKSEIHPLGRHSTLRPWKRFVAANGG